VCVCVCVHECVCACACVHVCICVRVCPLTPCGRGVALLQLPQFPQPGVLDDDGARLQRVLPHRVLALVPDLERPVVALHRLVHVDVVQLWQHVG